MPNKTLDCPVVKAHTGGAEEGVHKVRSPRKETLETEVGLLRFFSLSFCGEKIPGNGKRATVPCYEITRVWHRVKRPRFPCSFVAPIAFLSVGVSGHPSFPLIVNTRCMYSFSSSYTTVHICTDDSGGQSDG